MTIEIMSSGALNPNGAGLPILSFRISWPFFSNASAFSRMGPRMS